MRLELSMLAALSIALCLLQRPYGAGRLLRLCGRWGRRPGLAVLAVALVAFVASAAVSLGVAWPEPRIHDEFSYLLAGDTFAHGRLANPPHPLWRHFETFHVNQQPTYSSMYPPGQGLMLALGQVIGGHPLVGVWLSYALAAAAGCWMLQGWLPARWALVGALLVIVRSGFLGGWGDMAGYWTQSYWGGAVAMLGGALVFGAIRRLADRPTVGLSLVLAAGLVVLSNSRPYEGLVISLPVGVTVLVWIVCGRWPWRVALWRVIVPSAGVLLVSGVLMAAYNARLTGSPWLLPYQLNGKTYGMVPLFLWQPLGAEPGYSQNAIRDYHLNWAVPAYLSMRTVPGYAQVIVSRMREFAKFYLGVLLCLPVLMLPMVWTDRWMRWAILVCGVFCSGFLVTTWYQPHYAAPATGLVFVLVVQGLRHLRTWRWDGKPAGRILVGMLPPAYLVLLGGWVILHEPVDPSAWYEQRAHLLDELQRREGKHLVVVRYREGHSPHEEWVFNGADLDGAKVIWARDLGPEENSELLAYYADRRVWLLKADERPPVLVPYTEGQ